mmetsp:Transcript_18211/g.51459  ORF Transcript_18211/g.51459 Transcript_18211/m.51459 type:complete len:394 (+) Transcript_18211:706-1887(+)
MVPGAPYVGVECLRVGARRREGPAQTPGAQLALLVRRVAHEQPPQGWRRRWRTARAEVPERGLGDRYVPARARHGERRGLRLARPWAVDGDAVAMEPVGDLVGSGGARAAPVVLGRQPNVAQRRQLLDHELVEASVVFLYKRDELPLKLGRETTWKLQDALLEQHGPHLLDLQARLGLRSVAPRSLRWRRRRRLLGSAAAVGPCEPLGATPCRGRLRRGGAAAPARPQRRGSQAVREARLAGPDHPVAAVRVLPLHLRCVPPALEESTDAGPDGERRAAELPGRAACLRDLLAHARRLPAPQLPVVEARHAATALEHDGVLGVGIAPVHQARPPRAVDLRLDGGAGLPAELLDVAHEPRAHPLLEGLQATAGANLQRERAGPPRALGSRATSM